MTPSVTAAEYAAVSVLAIATSLVWLPFYGTLVGLIRDILERRR